MKKFLSLILVLAMLAGLCVAVNAEDNIGVLAPHAIISSSIKHYVPGEKFNIGLSVRISDVSNVEYLKVYMECNKDVIKYIGEDTVSAPDAACVFEIEETEDGYLMIFTLNRNISTDVFILYVLYDFEVVGMGDPCVSFTGETKMLGSDVQESVLSVDMPYNKVFTQEELPKIQLSGKYGAFLRDGVLFLNETVDRSEALSEVSSSDSEYPVELTKHYENDAVATGDSLYIYFHDQVSDEIFICVQGDVNCDGDVTASDARLALRCSAGLDFLYDYAEMAADANNDGDVNASDARQILRVAAGMESLSAPAIEMKVGDSIEISPLKNSCQYDWECTVSSDTGLSVVSEINPPENVEINPGTPFERTFTITADAVGMYTLYFELCCPWNEEIADEFDITVIVNN